MLSNFAWFQANFKPNIKIFKNFEFFSGALESIPGVPGPPLGDPQASPGASIIPQWGMIISHHPPGLRATLFKDKYLSWFFTRPQGPSGLSFFQAGVVGMRF